jgi:phosphomannomutase/phosphoglucomutase
VQDNAKHTPSRFSGKLNALAFHVLMTFSASAGGYFVLQQMVDSASVQQTKAVGEQISALIEQQTSSLKAQTALIAQQPDLQSSAVLKAVIPAEGTVPPTLSYTVQDLLNRTRTGITQPELALGEQKTIKINTATAMPAGGYLVAEWSFAPLQKALEQSLPQDYQLRLAQANSGDPVEILRLHANGNDGLLQPVAVNVAGWQVFVGPTHSSQLPLFAALITLLSGLAAMVPWLLRRDRGLATSPTRPTDTPLIENSPTLDITPPPSMSQALEGLPIVPITPVVLAKPEPTPHTPTVAPSENPAASAAPSTAAVATPETPSTTEPTSNLMEFSLADIMLPDLELSEVAAPRFPSHLFRAYDIRGRTADMPDELVSHIGRALGSVLRDNGQHQLVLGYDVRLTSEHYRDLIRDGLIASGLTVIDIGQVPTPIMQHAARQHDGNGIMITASHNAGDQNGFKWVIENHPPTPEEIHQVQLRCMEQNFISGQGQCRLQNFNDSYLDSLLGDVLLNQTFEVSLDGLNGAMGNIALSALRAAGCHVSSMNTDPDGHFPHGDPDPSQASRLDDLCNDVIISNSDIGFAFDGDGDRLVVIDAEGQIVSPDQLIALYAMMVLETQPGADIVFDVKCSRTISSVITQAGGRPVMVRSGNTFIRQALQSSRYDAAFGAEFSGHYFFNDGRGHNNDDGLYAAMRLLEWLALRGQSLAEVLKLLPQRLGTPDLYLALGTTDGRQLLANIQGAAEQMEDCQISLLDGVRLDFNDGFGIIRQSNTGPFMTARFDADNPESLHRIRQIFHDLVSPYHPDMAQRLTE